MIHRLNLNNMTWRTPIEIQSVETSDETGTDLNFNDTEYEPPRTILGHALVSDDLVHVLTYEVAKPIGDTW